MTTLRAAASAEAELVLTPAATLPTVSDATLPRGRPLVTGHSAHIHTVRAYTYMSVRCSAQVRVLGPTHIARQRALALACAATSDTALSSASERVAVCWVQRKPRQFGS